VERGHLDIPRSGQARDPVRHDAGDGERRLLHVREQFRRFPHCGLPLMHRFLEVLGDLRVHS
jgi:hypothetical protein